MIEFSYPTRSPGSGPAERSQRETPGQGHDRNKCTLQGRASTGVLGAPGEGEPVCEEVCEEKKGVRRAARTEYG